MEIIKISEVLKEVGKVIPGIHGSVKAVFKQRSGVGQYGPWTMQDIVIKDETGEISATFSGMPDLSPRKGGNITLSSTLVKGIQKGLAVIEETWTDKKTGAEKKSIKLKMDKDVFIDFGTTPVSDAVGEPIAPVAIPEDADDEEKALLQALAKKKAEKEAARLAEEARLKAAQSSQSTGKSLTKRDVQIVNLFRKALKGAVWACDKEGVPFWTESVATIFIAMRDDGVTDSMPVEFEKTRSEVSEMYPEAIGEPRDGLVQPDEPEQAIDQEPKTWREVKHDGVTLGSMTPNQLENLFNSFKPKINPKTKDYDMQDLYVVNSLKQWKNDVSV